MIDKLLYFSGTCSFVSSGESAAGKILGIFELRPSWNIN